ncbi:MAG TPA: universal stress protein [Xanthomonadales bacterium]|nr:universal stress protein [Xanthomonadales bacterium]
MSQLIVVGIDSSRCCQRSVEYAAECAKTGAAKLLLVHVIEWSQFSFSTPMENEVRHKRREDELTRAQADLIDPVVAELKAKGLEVDWVVLHGHPAQTIAELAEEKGASNIVVGRKGTSKLKAQLFGSVPSTLVQVSNVPVTVVP